MKTEIIKVSSNDFSKFKSILTEANGIMVRCSLETIGFSDNTIYLCECAFPTETITNKIKSFLPIRKR